MPALIRSLPSKFIACKRLGIGLQREARRFSDDKNGSIAIMFSLVILSLCLFAGAGIDLGRWHHARQQTIAAMDAAVLAGGRVLQLDKTNLEGARTAAQIYYAENVKDRIDVFQDTISFDAVDNKTAFAASGNAYIKTAFLGFAQISQLPLLDEAEAQFSKAVIRATGTNNTPVEIAMMLDVTGSMGGTKVTDMKKAATDLVNIVLPEDEDANPVRVSIVPFAEGVRLPSTANTAARGSPANTILVASGWFYTTYRKTDCVVERIGTNRYADVAPGSGNYVMTMYNSSGTCGLPAADELLPLTNNKTTLTTKIANLVLSGSTAGQIGTAWAWYTLSPNWNSLWSTSSAAAAYGSTTRKIAILMTDGEYNTQYNSSGISSGSGANGDSTTQARELCKEIKKKDVTVYTVGFALGSNQTAITTLSQCATDSSMAYTPTTGAELQQAFRDIALKINPLYLSH
jgi:Flp pilus assembly protein TadG